MWFKIQAFFIIGCGVATVASIMFSKNEVVIDPIVRVDLATSLIAALLARLEELRPQLPAEVK